ncbi:(2Fe-2S)-binding protein [Paracoccus sp. S-4012]|uniref:(2Fe-2S)-binding protein n=1 Tax=Paracoccus sp. S-4012 TaxID=2665648 RepID=UPI0018A1C7A8|nr:(2Fe-2S)-binding protein [Paracoccus sp. S-4012]
MARLVEPDAAAARVTLTLDGEAVSAVAGESLAGMMLARGVRVFRRMPDGSGRAPYCGMGTCFDCRIEVARPGEEPLTVRACVTAVEAGMVVSTGLGAKA